MLTFTSGELSTWAGQLTPSIEGQHHLEPQQFDFRDLPCPPQSVMVSSSCLERLRIERTRLRKYAGEELV